MKSYTILIFLCICFGSVFAAPSQEILPLTQESKDFFFDRNYTYAKYRGEIL